ncbi:MAG: hypothetical protein N3F05_02750 [Candidatus Diapherotrites archaeon]|nr:hypothetical protein [Candidatus Diapherotrites archaeon]
MEINPINIFIKPKKTIEKTISKPDFKISFLIILSPTILYTMFGLFAGFGFDLLDTIKHGAASYFAWIIISAVIYFFAFMVNSKDVKGKFYGILSAISFVWLFLAIIMCISFVVLYSSPKIFAMITEVKKQSASLPYAYNIFDENAGAILQKHGITESDLSDFSNKAFLASLLLIVILVYMLFVYPFLTIKQLTKATYPKSLLIYLLSGLLIVPIIVAFVLHL